MELTILMPCLNEAETIGTCIGRARKLLDDNHIDGEILISDNGSTDGSVEIAERLGARVTHCPVRGYGAALQHGIEQSRGTFVIMGDSDDSYHFDEAFEIVKSLREGFDVCMGTRLRGRIEPGAMPLLNRYLGNPVLTRIGRILFGISMSDFHCGMRGFRRDAVLGMNLATTGMEWASEMIIKCWLGKLSFAEVPITLHKDGRSRPPHLRRWRDGWRHLRFMLLHSPFWLFVVPGLFMMLLGIAGESVLMSGMLTLGKIRLDVHSMLVFAIMVLLGTQVLFAGLFSRLYSVVSGILPYDERFVQRVKFFNLEKLLALCLVIGIAGGGGFAYTLFEWYKTGFADLDYQITMRHLIPSLTLVAVAVQGVFNGFMLSMLYLKTRGTRLVNLD